MNNIDIVKTCADLHRRNSQQALGHAIKVGSEIRRAMGEFLRRESFTEIAPVIISPITDPLCHATGNVLFEYYGHQFQITKSMIFHKQMALLSCDRIFTFSPNVRLEPVELADTGRHLVEFTQLDLEWKGASRDKVMELAERLLIATLSCVKRNCSKELGALNRNFKIPKAPFERISYAEAYEQYGPDFEIILSEKHTEPFWKVDIPLERREFYDREDPKRQGILLDMDLVYPEGFGEALSGGEREYEPHRIKKRIEQQGLKPEALGWLLEFAKLGIPKSAGFGIGVERLTRFCCGFKRIDDVSLFPKVPGSWGL